mgnify:CR=1 FL=1|jgi:hypothetical protein
MKSEEKKGNFIINLSTIQKLFILFFILNLASSGMWVYLFNLEFGEREMYLATNIVCVVGFFLFWPPKLKL